MSDPALKMLWIQVRTMTGILIQKVTLMRSGTGGEKNNMDPQEEACSDRGCKHGIDIRRYLRKRCACKVQSLLFDLFNAFG